MKKICLRCQREYTTEGVNYCFDDGEPLHPALTSESRICPKCETRYGMGATQCARDLVPLVRAGDLAYARQRVCSDCGRTAQDHGAEFCGHDGARILARWEVGLVSRTAVPGELEATEDEKRKTVPDRPTTKPKTPGLDQRPGADAPAATSGPRPAVAMPAVKGLLVPDTAPPHAPPANVTPRAPSAAKTRGGGKKAPAPAPTGQSGTGWFVGASGVGDPSLAQSRPFGLGGGPAADTIDTGDSFGPQRVSRKLIAVAIVSALLCGGAFAFSRYAANRAPRSATNGGNTARNVAAAESAAVPAAAAQATAVAAAPAPLADAGAAPAPSAPAPAPPAPPAPPAAAKAEEEEEDEVTPKRKRRALRAAAPVEDPALALEAALRRAAAARQPREATTPTTTPPPVDEDPPEASRKRLTKADAERYFLEAAAEYKRGRPAEAMRRFRIIEQLGPKDRELQARVLLNLGHISEGKKSCPAAKAYYTRAAKLMPPDSALRPGLEARLSRTREACP